MSDEAHTPELVRLGVYRIDSFLGQGGMGEVFLAWDERLRRHVAIKRIRADKPLDQRHRARLRREAQAVARLGHPAIVQIFDILGQDAGDCLVMEYVEGDNLAERLEGGPLELRLAVRLAGEIAEGLFEAHGKGLVHRDLKPRNVIVTPTGHAKILDFGLARAFEPEVESSPNNSPSASLTHSGAIVGTAQAMSPEQAMGRRIDHRTDLFALGGLIYAMITGRAPFRGKNMVDTLRRVVMEEPPPIAELAPKTPTDLADLVRRLLAKDQSHRPDDALQVARELERIAARLTGSPPVKAAAADKELSDLSTVVGLTPEMSPETKPVIRVLVLANLVDSTQLVEELGDSRSFEISTRHDRAARDLLAQFGGIEIDKADGFLLLFERPADAVGYALAYHQSLDQLSTEHDVDLRARVGIHLGEVYLRQNTTQDVARGAKALEVEGLAKPMTALVTGLARAGQTLLTRGAFDLARRATAASKPADGELLWLAHGAYLFKGVEDPVRIFEVGMEGLAPLVEPLSSEKARRRVESGDEVTLGWRPAARQTIPHCAHWVLEERAGEGGFGEIWRARHKSGEQRVFKFCFEAARLSALKREVTLVRLLKEALGNRDDIARILDWNFDQAPFFLTAEYTEGGNLVEWAEQQGGLEQVPMATLLGLVADVAEALAAAHSVGILHKDVKPENVLITGEAEGRPRIRLTDFGLGLLTDRQGLNAPGITVQGFTETWKDQESSAGGTLRYLAPELLEGKPATLQADVYSLGVMLYQVVAGDFTRALAPGWQRHVDDPILCEDIATFVDGSPERRPSSALEIADRLRHLEERRGQREAEHRAREEAERSKHEMERSRRLRRALLMTAVGAIVVLAMVSVFAFRAMRSQDEADRRRLEAEDLVDFMLVDLRDGLESIGRLDLLAKVAGKAQGYLELQSENSDSLPELRRRGISLLNTADVLMDQGETARAIDGYRAARLIFEKMTARESGKMQYRLDLATSLSKLGEARQKEGDLVASFASFRAALAGAEELTKLQPEAPDVRHFLARARYQVGMSLIRQGKKQAALEILRAVVTPRRGSPPPPVTSWRHWQVYLDSWLAIGNIFSQQAKHPDAMDAYRGALVHAERLAREDPDNLNWRGYHARSRRLIANVHASSNEFKSALEAYDDVTRIYRELVAEDATNLRWLRRLGQSLFVMGTIQTRANIPEASLASFREARRIVEGLAARDPMDKLARLLLEQIHHAQEGMIDPEE